MVGVVKSVILGRPHLVLADLGGDDGLAPGEGVQGLNDKLGFDDLVVLFIPQGRGGFPFLDGFKPFVPLLDRKSVV